MFKKKGFIMAFILIISMIGMTACKKNVGAPEDNAQAEENEDETNTNTNTEETQEHLIGFSVIDMENPYFITLESAAKAELEKAGYRMITKNPETDSKLQETQIQEMIDEGIIPYKKALAEQGEEEERRLFYVAMTRAKNRLVISYVKEKNGREQSPSRFVGELFQNL